MYDETKTFSGLQTKKLHVRISSSGIYEATLVDVGNLKYTRDIPRSVKIFIIEDKVQGIRNYLFYTYEEKSA